MAAAIRESIAKTNLNLARWKTREKPETNEAKVKNAR